MAFYFILFVHCALCAVLTGLVLLQQGKGADAGATFGGGGSNTVFGAAGATDFITKLTTGLAIGFMVTSILMVRSYHYDGLSSLTSEPSDPTAGSSMPLIEEKPEVVTVDAGTEEAPAAAVNKEATADDNADGASETASTETAPTETASTETKEAAPAVEAEDATQDAPIAKSEASE